jgi:hypothetical protein
MQRINRKSCLIRTRQLRDVDAVSKRSPVRVMDRSDGKPGVGLLTGAHNTAPYVVPSSGVDGIAAERH